MEKQKKMIEKSKAADLSLGNRLLGGGDGGERGGGGGGRPTLT